MALKLQVFISSTFKDLIKERQAAVEAILKAGHIPAGMELFTAGDKSQWEVIQRWIIDCDIYMIILGGRYGSVEPTSGTSYTELEYDFAVSLGKPHFAVVITEEELKRRVAEHGNIVFETDYPDKHRAFREKVLSKMSSFFTDYKDVKLAILETVPQLAAEHDLQGWVRASEIPDTKALADELSRLHAENREFREKAKLQSKPLAQQASARADTMKEFSELAAVMQKITVDIAGLKSVLKKNGMDKVNDMPKEAPLLLLAFHFKDALMTGVDNRIGMSDLANFIFFTLCPKLQTYELMQIEKIAGVQYRRYSVTKKGLQFFAYLEKNLHKNDEK